MNNREKIVADVINYYNDVFSTISNIVDMSIDKRAVPELKEFLSGRTLASLVCIWERTEHARMLITNDSGECTSHLLDLDADEGCYLHIPVHKQEYDDKVIFNIEKPALFFCLRSWFNGFRDDWDFAIDCVIYSPSQKKMR